MYKINRTVACVIYYNEMDNGNIERCLKSIHNKFNYIIAVDGAYKEFPHDNFLSTDGSTEIAKKYCSRVIIPEREWIDEVEKRNEYLRQLCDGDLILVIDADEEMVGNINLLEYKSNYFCYDVKLIRHDDVPPYFIYRMFKYENGLKYIGTHHALFINEREHEQLLTNNWGHKKIEGFYLEHYQNERGKERVEAKGVYYRKLWDKEKEFRQKYHL